MKLIFLLDQLNFAGAQKRAVNLARKLDPDRFEVHVVCLYAGGPLQPALDEARIKLSILDFDSSPWSLSTIASLWRLTRLLRKEKPQIVHTFSYWCGHYGTLAGRLAGVPSVITGRVCLYDLKPQGRIARTLERLLNPFATVVVAISQAVRADTIAIEGVPESKVDLVYNGVSLASSSTTDDADSVRNELGLSRGEPVIVMVANFFPYKRHETLIRTAAKVLLARPNVRFLLVGRPSGEFERLQALAQELGVAHAIFWLGAREDIGRILAGSTIGVLCSESEAMSNSILEYMDARLPVVATDVGGNPEMVVDGETGWLFPVGDAEALANRLLELLEDPDPARRMGEAGQDRVHSKFSLDQMAAGYAKIYERCVARR